MNSLLEHLMIKIADDDHPIRNGALMLGALGLAAAGGYRLGQRQRQERPDLRNIRSEREKEPWEVKKVIVTPPPRQQPPTKVTQKVNKVAPEPKHTVIHKPLHTKVYDEPPRIFRPSKITLPGDLGSIGEHLITKIAGTKNNNQNKNKITPGDKFLNFISGISPNEAQKMSKEEISHIRKGALVGGALGIASLPRRIQPIGMLIGSLSGGYLARHLYKKPIKNKEKKVK